MPLSDDSDGGRSGADVSRAGPASCCGNIVVGVVGVVVAAAGCRYDDGVVELAEVFRDVDVVAGRTGSRPGRGEFDGVDGASPWLWFVDVNGGVRVALCLRLVDVDGVAGTALWLTRFVGGGGNDTRSCVDGLRNLKRFLDTLMDLFL